jgi:hypothetical protein
VVSAINVIQNRFHSDFIIPKFLPKRDTRQNKTKYDNRTREQKIVQVHGPRNQFSQKANRNKNEQNPIQTRSDLRLFRQSTRDDDLNMVAHRRKAALKLWPPKISAGLPKMKPKLVFLDQADGRSGRKIASRWGTQISSESALSLLQRAGSFH